jgi:hypothetical protein
MRFAVPLAVVVLLLTHSRARPCSLAEAPMPGALPADSATMNARPLLFALVEADPVLRHDNGAVVPLEVVDALAGTFSGHLLTRVWRPVEPLAAGKYVFEGAADPNTGMTTINFFVDPALPLEAPALGDATFHLTIDEPEEGGCGAMSSCDGVDFTQLELTLPTGGPELLRLELTNPATGHRRVELVAPSDFGGDHATVLLFNSPNRWPGSFKNTRMCVLATPLTDYGAIGPTADLGCFDPTRDDPRVNDTRGGCSTADPRGSMWLWLSVLLLAQARVRDLERTGERRAGR